MRVSTTAMGSLLKFTGGIFHVSVSEHGESVQVAHTTCEFITITGEQSFELSPQQPHVLENEDTCVSLLFLMEEPAE